MHKTHQKIHLARVLLIVGSILPHTAQMQSAVSPFSWCRRHMYHRIVENNILNASSSQDVSASEWGSGGEAPGGNFGDLSIRNQKFETKETHFF